MDNETRYCYSWDREHYFGNYITAQEALADAKSEALHEDVYIGTCVEPELRWSGIEELVIAQIEENLYYDVGESSECFDVSDEAERELMLRLDVAIEDWIKDMNIKPNCYRAIDIHKVKIEEVKYERNNM